jgi:hypothetical protein
MRNTFRRMVPPAQRSYEAPDSISLALLASASVTIDESSVPVETHMAKR